MTSIKRHDGDWPLNLWFLWCQWHIALAICSAISRCHPGPETLLPFRHRWRFKTCTYWFSRRHTKTWSINTFLSHIHQHTGSASSSQNVHKIRNQSVFFSFRVLEMWFACLRQFWIHWLLLTGEIVSDSHTINFHHLQGSTSYRYHLHNFMAYQLLAHSHFPIRHMSNFPIRPKKIKSLIPHYLLTGNVGKVCKMKQLLCQEFAINIFGYLSGQIISVIGRKGELLD